MGIHMTSSGGDEFIDEVIAQAIADAEEKPAAGFAAKAREEGRSSLDDVDLEIEVDEPGFKLDEARIRRLANEELARDTA